MIPIVDLTPVTLKCARVSADDATPTAVDVSAYDGDAICVVAVTPVSGTTPTCDIKLQQFTAATGAFTDITGAAITQVAEVASLTKIQLKIGELSKYLRAPIDVGGTNPVYDIAIILLAQLKYS
jgi:hypothetical protein